MGQPPRSLFLLTLTKEAPRDSRPDYDTLASLDRSDKGTSYLNTFASSPKPFQGHHRCSTSSVETDRESRADYNTSTSLERLKQATSCLDTFPSQQKAFEITTRAQHRPGPGGAGADQESRADRNTLTSLDRPDRYFFFNYLYSPEVLLVLNIHSADWQMLLTQVQHVSHLRLTQREELVTRCLRPVLASREGCPLP